ncbi:hypothetical protein JW960_21280 [candidate division KSB1 bacterium]|nr:hypothetical protein [candidate division KSB1 bacterium]
MPAKQRYIGSTKCQHQTKHVSGHYVDIDNEQFYKISNYDAMPPFLMSIVSDSDHWMFIASNGGVTAGRKNPDNALFPYYTDDRIYDAADQTGSKTIIRLETDQKTLLWEPFSDKYSGVYNTERNLYKNVLGNKIIFEECNHDLALTFQTAWFNSEKFGFVKQSTIQNHNLQAVLLHILDGLQNILPYGITRRFQLEYSTLSDAFKKNELLPETGVGIFSMSSIPTDKAEPSEALKATTVWFTGLNNPTVLLSINQLNQFRRGEPVIQETDMRGVRGAYFLGTEIKLPAEANRSWYIISDINQDTADVINLLRFIKQQRTPENLILADVTCGSENLKRIIANADGLQTTADQLSSARHFSNVLFNAMRGGVFDKDYTVEKDDLVAFLEATNRHVLAEHRSFLDGLPTNVQHGDLLALVEKTNNPDFEKLCYEYLPITFGRRHGDPSRPWNLFSIEIKNEHGDKILNYQGNWRDLFQNWEALAVSFPEYIESMITKFVNASTADGYNPYRVTRTGFDWEALDPADPWSYIGYWGDHQIVYLLKLLELSKKYHPQRLSELLVKPIFAYANVPYRIKSYDDMLRNPHDTIEFDAKLDRAIHNQMHVFGSDGAFLQGENGGIYHVTLAEKLLVPLLAKLANFIPEAGIWMNTQRPEWNDANNALVGYGVSMVTLYYMRRYVSFCQALFRSSAPASFSMSREVAEFLTTISRIFHKYEPLLNAPISGMNRRRTLDELGYAATSYRQQIYRNGFTDTKSSLSRDDLLAFFDTIGRHIDHTIRANKRSDNLYHAYNLMKVEADSSISIRHLYEMLEGQVAVLSSGFLSVNEAVNVLDALRSSALYRDDQQSYILYPNRQLPEFTKKNRIPATALESSELLKTMIANGDKKLVMSDENGDAHFNGRFRNGRVLKDALENLRTSEYGELVEKEQALILDIYEYMFDHQSFTGRSGTFFKYEGLGSIYWHMVSKLLLAIQENYFQAVDNNADQSVLEKLRAHYYDVRNGIGVTKSPDAYGAFPTDPYSHTPAHAGVQQPGMTGQVKEDILCRFNELGIIVRDGRLRFMPTLLNRSEFLTEATASNCIKPDKNSNDFMLDAGRLMFTYCQVPIVYTLADVNRTVMTLTDGSEIAVDSLSLDENWSASIFKREGKLKRIDVQFSI